MAKKDLAKELSKYSKEALISAISSNMVFNIERILSEVRFSEQRLIIKQMDDVNEEMSKIPLTTVKNFIEYKKLNDKWLRLNNKLDSLMKLV